MTFTQTCSNIVLTTVNNLGTNSSSIVKWSIDCGTEEVRTATIGSATFSITPATLGQAGPLFTNGVYSFTWVNTLLDGTVKTENVAFYLECTPNCSIYNDYLKKDKDLILTHQALLASKSCGACSASDLCELNKSLTHASCTCNCQNCSV